MNRKFSIHNIWKTFLISLVIFWALLVCSCEESSQATEQGILNNAFRNLDTLAEGASFRWQMDSLTAMLEDGQWLSVVCGKFIINDSSFRKEHHFDSWEFDNYLSPNVRDTMSWYVDSIGPYFVQTARIREAISGDYCWYSRKSFESARQSAQFVLLEQAKAKTILYDSYWEKRGGDFCIYYFQEQNVIHEFQGCNPLCLGLIMKFKSVIGDSNPACNKFEIVDGMRVR